MTRAHHFRRKGYVIHSKLVPDIMARMFTPRITYISVRLLRLRLRIFSVRRETELIRKHREAESKFHSELMEMQEKLHNEKMVIYFCKKTPIILFLISSSFGFDWTINLHPFNRISYDSRITLTCVGPLVWPLQPFII